MTGMSRQTVNRIASAADSPERSRFGPELLAAFGLGQTGPATA